MTSETTEPAASPTKIMNLRYAGACGCGRQVAQGARAGWDRAAKQVVCLECLTTQPSPGAPVPGIEPAQIKVDLAGASLQREYERRSNKREERIRSNHPRLGGFLLAVTSEPASTRAFEIGAIGEQRAAQRVQEKCSKDVLFLLNRSLGAGRRDGDIDMIAIGPSGVYVVDIKHYKDKKVEVRRRGGLLSPAKEQLYIGGRDSTKLLDSMARQLDAVRTALAGASATQISVTPALCFLDADLPLFGTPRIGGVPCLGPKATAKLVSAPGTLDSEARSALRNQLDNTLPPAH